MFTVKIVNHLVEDVSDDEIIIGKVNVSVEAVMSVVFNVNRNHIRDFRSTAASVQPLIVHRAKVGGSGQAVACLKLTSLMDGLQFMLSHPPKSTNGNFYGDWKSS